MTLLWTMHDMFVCRQQCVVSHSCIKLGQSPGGLQVNVAYFKWLFLLGHSAFVTHVHAEDSHTFQTDWCVSVCSFLLFIEWCVLYLHSGFINSATVSELLLLLHNSFNHTLILPFCLTYSINFLRILLCTPPLFLHCLFTSIFMLWKLSWLVLMNLTIGNMVLFSL